VGRPWVKKDGRLGAAWFDRRNDAIFRINREPELIAMAERLCDDDPGDEWIAEIKAGTERARERLELLNRTAKEYGFDPLTVTPKDRSAAWKKSG